jgi:hypothetical protein
LVKFKTTFIRYRWTYLGENKFGLDGYEAVVENDWKGIDDLLIYNFNEQAYSWNMKYFE